MVACVTGWPDELSFCLSPAVSDEIIMHEGVTAVYKSNVDLFFCVLGAQNENEVCHVCVCVCDSS